jgi:hypothetical protein
MLPTDDRVTRLCLEQALEERTGGAVGVRDVRRRSADLTTSYPVALLDVALDNGETLGVFLKDFGVSRLPKPGRPPEREPRVYRELLSDVDLGTPGYLGCIWTPERRWLMLELVEAPELKSLDLDAWLLGVAALGRMHAHFASQGERLSGCDFLERHDARFFEARAERALHSLASFPAACSRRLERLLVGHEHIARRLAGLPTTLVHGSFRPRNALFDARRGRVAIIDWELAAVGSGLYDLGFFAEGFRGAKLDRLIEAYRRGAAEGGSEVPDGAATRRLLDGFRFHKELKSLGDAQSLGFAQRSVDKILGLAEEAHAGMTA